MSSYGKVDRLRMMMRIRCFEERVVALKEAGQIAGPVHTCIGQEAVAVGVCAALSREDYIVGTHRSHGLMIAKGAECSALMAEIFGRQTGTSGGKGGSMHVNDKAVGGLGASGIVGSGPPIACGAAFASKYMNVDKVSCVFFGDGSVNEGVFYECMNLASLWQLPVLFILENNKVAVTTVLKQVSPSDELYHRARAHGMQSRPVDGQDVGEVYENAASAVAYIRSGKGPVLLEANTLRFREHQEGRAYTKMKETGYRDNDEVNHWIANKDPIVTYSDKMLGSGEITMGDLERIRDEERRRIEAAVSFAEQSEHPDKDTALRGVFAGATL